MLYKTFILPLIFLYSLSNVISTIVFIDKGFLGGDFFYIYEVDDNLIIISLLIILFTFFIVYKLSEIFFEKRIIGLHYQLSLKKDGWFFDFVMLLISIFYFLSVVYFKVGVIGISLSESNASKIVIYVFAILQPVYLIAIYLFVNIRNANLTYYFILVLYSLSISVSGITTPLIFIFVLILILIDNKITKLTFNKVFAFLLLGLALYPFIRLLKFVIIGYNSELVGGTQQDMFFVYQLMSDKYNGFIDMYFSYLVLSLERIQHVANVSFIIDNYSVLNNYLGHTESYNFITENWVGKVIGAIIYPEISWNGYKTINYHFANYITPGEWASQTGLIGRFLLEITNLPEMILFVIISYLLVSCLSNQISIDKYISVLSCLIMFIMLCHGWFNEVIKYIQALFVYFSMIFIYSIFFVSKRI